MFDHYSNERFIHIEVNKNEKEVSYQSFGSLQETLDKTNLLTLISRDERTPLSGKVQLKASKKKKFTAVRTLGGAD